MKFVIFLSLFVFVCVSHAATIIKPGAYRVDVNGKTRNLCVDDISNAELSAAGWQQRLAEQGVRCSLRPGARDKAATGWVARCSAPGMGKVYTTAYRVSVKVNANQGFELQTLLSGDLQAKILITGQRLRERDGTCTSQHETFRPWQ